MGIISNIQSCLSNLNIISTIVRMALALICGGIIGVERAKSNQAAGMRTYILVCLGSTLVMLTGQYMYELYNAGDPARLGAQVISGIGFLGAGSIITEGHTKIKGLTTAAGLWASACIGIAIGIGYYGGGIVATILVYIVISKFKEISHKFNRNDVLIRFYLEFSSSIDIETICSVMKTMGLEIDNVILNNQENSNIYSAILSIKDFEDKNENDILNLLKEIRGIITVKYIE